MGTAMTKIDLTGDDLIALLELAKRNNTLRQWANLAVDWIKAAEAEIVSLRKEGDRTHGPHHESS